MTTIKHPKRMGAAVVGSVKPGDDKTEVEDPAQLMGDLPGCVPTKADLKLKEACGDHLHQNDGTLNGKNAGESWCPSQPNDTKLQEERWDDGSFAF
jgi:hypothetical protein